MRGAGRCRLLRGAPSLAHSCLQPALAPWASDRPGLTLPQACPRTLSLPRGLGGYEQRGDILLPHPPAGGLGWILIC